MTAWTTRAGALLLAVSLPVGAAAAGPQGGDRGGGARPAVPAARSAPAARPAPVGRPQAPPQARVRPAPPAGGGFNFNRDTAPVAQRAAPPQRVAPLRRVAPPQRAAPVVQRAAPTYRRPPTTAGNGPHTGHFTGRVIANPRHFSGTWGWNHGVAWRPAPTYWGGGFWGPWALGAVACAVLFGAIIDDATQTEYPSYQVEPDSPGAQALQSYGLQQTQCGPPNLVDIWGPDNSVVCALPNDTVAPGDYELDPETLNLIPASP